MNKNKKKIINFAIPTSIVLFLSILIVYNNCGKQSSLNFEDNRQVDPNSSNPSVGVVPGGLTTSRSSADAFRETVHPVLVQGCARCHGVFQQPLFALNDSNLSHSNLLTSQKVNLQNIPSSRIVLRLRSDRHNCPGDCLNDADVMEQAIIEWKSRLGETETVAAEEAEENQSEGIAINDLLDPNNLLQNGSTVLSAAQGELKAPMVVQNEGIHEFITAPPGSGTRNFDSSSAGTSHHKFIAPFTGTYKVWGFVNPPNSNDNSFWLKMNDDNYLLWDLTSTGTIYAWQEFKQNNVQETFELEKGEHNLEIKQREDGAKIEYIAISADPNFDPEGQKPNNLAQLKFDLSEASGSPNTFLIFNLTNFDEFSYKITNLNLTNPNDNIRIKGLKILFNGSFNPQNATYTFLDTIIESPGGSVSEISMIALSDKGPELDKVSVAFEAIEKTNNVNQENLEAKTQCDNLSLFVTNVRTVLNNRCAGCHGGGNSYNVGGTDQELCDRTLSRINFNSPIDSPLIQKPLNALPFHGGGANRIDQAIAEDFILWINSEK
jgi:hypothetical protein